MTTTTTRSTAGRFLAALVGCALLPLFVSSSSAGPLDPPSGPTEATGVRLLFPQFATGLTTIDEPGQYRLMGDASFNGLPGTGSILIEASDVVLDLNGFKLSGPGSTGTGSGAASTSTLERIIIRNGEISGWNFGFVADPDNVTGLIFENVEFIRIRALAIAAGDGVIIRDCVFLDCADVGEVVSVRDNAIIERCEFRDCFAEAIVLRAGGVVRNNTFDGVFVAIQGADNDRLEGYNRILDNTINDVSRGIDFDTNNPLQLIYRNVITDAINAAIDAAASDQPQAFSSVGALPLSNFID
ncbi:MAG: hypothetical protein Tsb0013_15720 [Phycisphaerales bacterium]